jgi:hypothetical protein
MEGSAIWDTSWITGGNGKRASITERCAASREGNALKGATPRALPARNKAGTVRGGVQGVVR